MVQETPESILNYGNFDDLWEQYEEYCQTELQKLQSQLQLARDKMASKVIWENWETQEGLEKWIKELEDKIKELEVQEKYQSQIQQFPK